MEVQTHRRSSAWTLGIVAVHLLMTPVAIGLTLLAYGFEDALTPHNQRSWTPIIVAQSALLSMYAAFGPGSTLRRLAIVVVGSVVLTIAMLWGCSQLSTFRGGYWPTFAGLFRTQSLIVMTPPCMGAVILMHLRAFGERRWADCRVGVKDILLITAFAAGAVAWFNHAATRPIGGGKFVYDIVSMPGLFRYSLARCAGVLAAYWMLFGSSRRWLGGLTLLTYGVWTSAQDESRAREAWIAFAYTWSIVIATAVAYRQFVLRRKKLATDDLAGVGTARLIGSLALPASPTHHHPRAFQYGIPTPSHTAR